MMNKRIFLSPPHMSGHEKHFVDEAFDTNWIAPVGPNVDAFENEIANYMGVNHVAAVASGTAALHLALINLDVKKGDEVIVSSLTFSATVNPIIYQNATPVFVDSEKETWNMCPKLLKDAIEDRIKKGKKPKAIIPVHLYGVPAQIDKIVDIAKEFDIPIVEDAAESLGSTYHGKHTSTFGSMGVLSFNGNKIITTSGGGALVSDNEEFIKHARFLATQARDNFPWYHHTHIGYNYRMSNVVAGIGRGQMIVLNDRVAKKREICNFYKDLFADYEGVTMCVEPRSAFGSRWLTCIQIDPQLRKDKNPAGLIAAFEADNIESRHIWKPMHLQPVFETHPAYVNGVSESLFLHGVCLPSGTAMSEHELNRIQNVVKKYF
jgi:dTDP-4-amino-4,6-dideoxygalactose transaminase